MINDQVSCSTKYDADSTARKLSIIVFIKWQLYHPKRGKEILHETRSSPLIYPQQNDLGINCLKYTNAFSVVVAFLFWTDHETPELNVMKTPWNAVLKSNQLRVDWRWTKRCTAKNNAILINLSVAFFGIVVQQFNVVILLNIYSHVHHDYFPHSTNHRINLSVFMPYIPGWDCCNFFLQVPSINVPRALFLCIVWYGFSI